MVIHRRRFLAAGLSGPAFMSLTGSAPLLWQSVAEAAERNRQETILVVVQLSGGNDGLNTIAPVKDPHYRKNRPTLAVSPQDALRIDDDAGWHPAAHGLDALLQDNRLAAIQCVGYENPNRSHFESMDIWHTCDRKEARRPVGWLGQFLDAELDTASAGGDAPAMHLGEKKLPLALAAQRARTATVRSLEQFQLQTDNDSKLRDEVASIAKAKRESGRLLDFVQSSTNAALDASRRIESARSQYKTDVEYPDTRLAQKLKTVAQVIDADLSTRVYYLELGGFDTHSRQGPAHRALLRELGDGLRAFTNDLKLHGHGERVLTMCFSEFGRRVKENASEGTDHGAAGPMLLIGPVKPGLHGPKPDLQDLHQGDLRFKIDFRRVYATVLEQWLGSPSEVILGAKHQPLSVLAKA